MSVAISISGSLAVVISVGSGTLLGASLLLGGLAAAGVFFLFKVNLVTFSVQYLVFEVVERLVRENAELAFEFPSPFPVVTHESFLQVGVNKGMHIHDKAAYVQGVDKVIDLVFLLVGKKL